MKKVKEIKTKKDIKLLNSLFENGYIELRYKPWAVERFNEGSWPIKTIEMDGPSYLKVNLRVSPAGPEYKDDCYSFLLVDSKAVATAYKLVLYSNPNQIIITHKERKDFRFIITQSKVKLRRKKLNEI